MNQKLKKILIYKDTTILKTIDSINKGGMGIALVIDKDNTLLGTVTDGDIRRGLINKIEINDHTSKVMNKKFQSIFSSENKELARKKMLKFGIYQLPVIDKNKKIIDIFLFKDFEKNMFSNSVFMLAGGFGKRLMPLTKNTPKPMLTVSGKPILEIVIENFKKHGFSNFIISTFYKSNYIKKYFQNGKKLKVNISYIEEKKPLGTAGSLGLINIDNFNFPIIVTNSDVITDINYESLLKSHIKSKCEMTIGLSQYNYTIPYGEAILAKRKLLKINEKPVFTHNVNAGIYVLNASVVKKVKKNNYLDMTDLISSLLKTKIKINPFFIFESWKDIGTKSELENLYK